MRTNFLFGAPISSNSSLCVCILFIDAVKCYFIYTCCCVPQYTLKKKKCLIFRIFWSNCFYCSIRGEERSLIKTRINLFLNRMFLFNLQIEFYATYKQHTMSDN
ncbi:hypothetical protein EDC94DRAFT_33656 [Helicostylum pulchrum]|nr:hypothetical protein EDC94DRAFT_33656 [Helicostylum pulchrum]